MFYTIKEAVCRDQPRVYPGKVQTVLHTIGTQSLEGGMIIDISILSVGRFNHSFFLGGGEGRWQSDDQAFIGKLRYVSPAQWKPNDDYETWFSLETLWKLMDVVWIYFQKTFELATEVKAMVCSTIILKKLMWLWKRFLLYFVL